MLYWLVAFSGSWSPLNVFRYISVRAGGAAATALLISLVMGPPLIAALREKKIGQSQRKDGPSTHLSKQGTPTMGGLLIFTAVVLSTLLWMRPDVRFTWILLFVSTTLTGVGFWDDYLKLIRKDPKGAPSKTKFLVQTAVALLVVGYLAGFPPNPEFSTSLLLPYAKRTFLDLGVLYYAIGVFIIVGSSNAVNLTDGLDGLAAGTIIFCAIAYAVFAYFAGHMKFAVYLQIIPVAGAGEITIFLAALIGACLGFLWFNSYPAEIFMGDTSSLFLGGVIGTIALCVKQELLLPIVGGVFVMETLSVIAQMASYKLRGGKRIFRMAPIHHHFELGGVAEPKVTVRFWITSIVLMLAAIASLKIR
ncbi:MAG: phospho-N-acetylmuramoyl-pentapeptide-transferase [Elusimicrobia bacterium CG1_02_63_36]|nr:MAG: phospho-N-acetylmuramoyl-pentapeptide-transferase [Elusimicrobia bacterium CG1_02_63_36]PJB25297.1 MAG: phospho-N-acetylmuramoyl-pentapeptide-transferase [Elusimicrobia bacterium CG_4_9_14_3_um_filter_62_55]